jgi:hypothetical protein
MKVFHEGRLPDRRIPRSDVREAPDKDAAVTDFLTGDLEEFHRIHGLLHDLEKQLIGLRETLQHRQARIAHVKHALSDLRTLLFPSRIRWWRKWLPW